MAFVSSPSSTNKVNTAYGVSTANTRVSSTNTQVSPANTQVSTANTQVSAANLSNATIYAFLANQPNGSQLIHEDLEQIHEDDSKEMNLKWQLALLSIRTRRECRGTRNQVSKNRNQDSSRRTVNVEETSSKAIVATHGAGFDWSYMADDEVPTNMALMAISDSEFNKSEFNLATYKRGLASAEEQLVFYKKNEVIFWLFSPSNLDLSYSGLEKFQHPEFEGYGPKTSKSVSEDISNEAHCNYHQRERVVSGNNYTRVNYNYSAKKAHPNAHRNMVPRAVLIKIGLRSLNVARLVNTAHPKTTVYSARPMPKAVNTARPNSAVVNSVRENQGHPQKEDQGYVDSGCSRHMTENMSNLSDFKEFDGKYVTFRGGAKGGKITATKDETSGIHGSTRSKLWLPLPLLKLNMWLLLVDVEKISKRVWLDLVIPVMEFVRGKDVD
ncbi:hypothetical protein Tco_0913133 [Tanacetum coccineum]